MRWRLLLAVSVLALPVTGGCARCQADCAGPEVIVELVDPNAVSVEVCQLGRCETKKVGENGGSRSVWLPVEPEGDTRVRAEVAVLDGAGSVLVAETIDAQLPDGDCGCEVGPISLRASERSITPT